MQQNQILKILFTAVILLTTLTSAKAQDMLARQAPVDRKMKAVDTLTLRDLIYREQLASPAAELYDEWDNVFAHKATELPDSFLIDLRDFCMPTPSRIVTSNFGARWGRQHKGIDLKVYTGDTIRAAFKGKVRMVKYDRRGYGNYIVIRHDNGLETIYAHLSRSIAQEEQDVEAGDVIGLGGNTGRSTGSHLHFETRLCGVALNPAILFDFRNQDIVADTYLFRKDTYKEEGRYANLVRGKVNGGAYTRGQVTGEEEVVVKTVDNDEPRVRTRYHKVKKGDTLSSIAKKHGTSINKLCKLNGISKSKRLKLGQIIRYT